MNEKVTILICKNFERELQVALEDLKLEHLNVSFHTADCRHCLSARNKCMREHHQLKSNPRVINLLEAMAKLLNKDHEPDVTEVYTCHGMLASEDLLKKYIHRGDYLITPGWLENWKYYITEEAGFDESTARDFFGESVNQLCLLDSGVYEQGAENMKAFSTFLGKSYEVVPVGMEYFKMTLLAVNFHYTNQMLIEDLKFKNRNVAEYAMVIDFLAQIAGLLQIDELLENIFELFAMMTGATKLAFLHTSGDKKGNVKFFKDQPYATALFEASIQEWEEPFKLCETGQGFIFALKYDEEYLGLLEVDGIQIVEKIMGYVELSKSVMEIFSLSLFNAKHYGDLILLNSQLNETNVDLEKLVTDRTMQLIQVNEGLESTNAMLEEEIAERYEVERKLLYAKEEAERANTAKTNFLENMSHEIRTPMNGILGMTELTLMTNPSEEQEKYLNLIKKATGALITIINDILDYSKIDKDLLFIENTHLNIGDLFKDVIALYDIGAKQKKLQLHYQIDGRLPKKIVADGVRIRQILTNLIGNAIKFTNHGGISLGAEYIGSEGKCIEICFSVRDTGIGIPAEQQEEIFERFTQVDSSYTKRYQGTGLGLAISKKLVEKMGGKIWVESDVGRGSTFYFSLPCEKLHEELEPVPNLRDKKLNLKAFTTKAPVLIADDDSTSRQFMFTLLNKYGIHCVVAEDGVEAVQLYKDEKPVLILMDIQMPLQDGLTATRKIREIEKAAGDEEHTPIVALTAYAFREDVQNCLDAGMNAYISKPVDILELNQVLMKYLL